MSPSPLMPEALDVAIGVHSYSGELPTRGTMALSTMMMDWESDAGMAPFCHLSRCAAASSCFRSPTGRAGSA